MLSEETRAGLTEARREDAPIIAEILSTRIGQREMQFAFAMVGADAAVNPFAGGDMRADELPEAEPDQELWFGMYRGKVHLINGQTGAGKSSMIYNLCIHAARNEPLWRCFFGMRRPLRVFYVDPENAGLYREENKRGGLCSKKVKRIMEEEEKLPPTLVFHDGQGVNLSNPVHMQFLAERIRQGIDGCPFDLVVLDPLLALFGVEDENANAEMQRYLDALRRLSRETDACIIAIHHTGKIVAGGVMAGRGASSIPGAADVVFTFESRGEDDEEADESYTGERKEKTGCCRLRIEKDRPGEFGKTALYLKPIGRDRFERAEFADWRAATKRQPAERKAEIAAREITELLEQGGWRAKTWLIAELDRRGIGERNGEAAIKELKADGTIAEKKEGRGGALFYALSTFAISQNPIGVAKVSQGQNEAKTNPPMSDWEQSFAATDNRAQGLCAACNRAPAEIPVDAPSHCRKCFFEQDR
jgi:RecA-family ATPase